MDVEHWRNAPEGKVHVFPNGALVALCSVRRDSSRGRPRAGYPQRVMGPPAPDEVCAGCTRRSPRWQAHVAALTR